MAQKKSFKNSNPALSFVSIPEEENTVAETATVATEASTQKPQYTGKLKAPEGYKLNPEFIEVKSKRVQLILQPSVVARIKEYAKDNGLSMNEAVNEAIQAYLQNNGY